MLIGIDFLTAHKCIINFDTNTVYSKGGPNKIVFGCLDKVYRITVAETVTLSPNMVADIPCEVQGMDGLDECMGVLEPADTFSEKYSAGAFRMAVTVKGGRIPVRVLNYLNKPLTIYSCSSIGDLYPLAGEGESQQETNGGVGYKVVPPGAPKEDVEIGLEAKQCSAVFVKDADVHSLSVEEMFPISSNFVPEEETLRLYDMLSTYADCISKGPWDLGTAKGVRHTIDTGSAQPIQVPPRRVPFHKRQEMRSQVDEMLEADITEPSDSPWSSPVVLVAKPDGSQCFCVDYRALNSVTKRDLYPLPRCDDILESLSGAQWFSHLDLLRGYWQIDVAEKDREKMAFATPDGLYQFRKLSFGLTNAPACFMRAMHLILRGLCWSDCLVYLDDIIVFGRTLQEHRERLSLVLSRLTEAGLKINPKKCKLLCEQVVVLGHVVSGKGISTDPEKIRVIKEWPVPADESQLRAFLGTAGYYRQFVPNYAHIASPLHRACQKGDRFRWTAECKEAFLHIKRKLTNAPILAFPQLDVPFILDNDASDSGLGAVLSQVQCGKERVIAYAARALSKAERNYSTTRKELLALVWGTEHFETFLYGRRFLVRTDHSALQWLRNFKNPRGQVARWLERLSDFDFEVEHRPGQLHGNADGLSRFPLQEGALEKIERDTTLIQSVNMGPLSRESKYTCGPKPKPFDVACNMTDKNGVGVTVISHDSESRTSVQGYEEKGRYSRDIHYTGASLSQLANLATVSAHCEQFIRYECYGSVLWFNNDPYGWWVLRDSTKMTYWGGRSPGSAKCTCDQRLSCAKLSDVCNCDKNDNVWREDSGLLTDKQKLPVKQLRFGDTGDTGEQGYHTLGKFKCYGTA